MYQRLQRAALYDTLAIQCHTFEESHDMLRDTCRKSNYSAIHHACVEGTDGRTYYSAVRKMVQPICS